jgi:hypothetical protein
MEITIWQLEEFKFPAVGAAQWSPRGQGPTMKHRHLLREPDWDQVAEVATALFMFSGGRCACGQVFPMADLWKTASGRFPCVVQNENEYLDEIVGVIKRSDSSSWNSIPPDRGVFRRSGRAATDPRRRETKELSSSWVDMFSRLGGLQRGSYRQGLAEPHP